MSERLGELGAASGAAAAPAEDAGAMLLEYLRANDVPCPLCGYNLRGLASPRCPECGKEVGFVVTLAEPYLRAWVALAAAVFCCAGIGVFFAMLILPRGRIMGPAHQWPMLVAALSWFWANIPLAGVVVWLRREFLRLGKGAQRWLAAGAWVMSVIAFCVVVGILF